MTSFKRILVIVDPAVGWTPALDRASALARATRAAVWLGLFRGGSRLPWVRSLGGDAPRIEKSLRDRLGDRLRQIAERVRSQSGVEVDVIDDHHRPNAMRILEFVERLRIDVILKDAAHDSAASRLLFLPLDWDLLRESKVPIWLTAPSGPMLPRSLAVAVDPAHAVHGAGAINDAILASAAQLARTTGASIQVLTAFAGVPVEPIVDPLGFDLGWNPAEFQEQMRTDHLAAFDELLARHAIRRDDGVVLEGPAGPAILEWMRKGIAELLVIGAIHRHGAERVFVGSTAEYLVSRAACDVLAVPGIATSDPTGSEIVI
jgi:universal stress protein E